MKIEFSLRGKEQVTIFNYITEMLTKAPEAFNRTAGTPVGKHLFDTGENVSKLEETKATIFHHIVVEYAKSRFLAKPARPDIQLAVAFLCTRVRASMNTTGKSWAHGAEQPP